MHARVTELRVLPGKMHDFVAAVQSVLPLIRKQVGFRAVVVLRTAGGPAPEARIISLWDSLEDMKASEKNLFLYQALSRILAFCQGFPPIHEYEVLVNEFAAD